MQRYMAPASPPGKQKQTFGHGRQPGDQEQHPASWAIPVPFLFYCQVCPGLFSVDICCWSTT